MTALADLTTMRVGGPANEVVRVHSVPDVVAAILDLDARGSAVLVVGGGSNLVVADAGFAGTVVRFAHDRLDVSTDATGVRLVADAGADWDAVVAESVRRGWGGLECLSGIPGTVGATPVQNVGAYGVEVADVCESVQILDRRTGVSQWVSPADLRMGYRTSALKRRDDRLVLQVAFRLSDDGLSAPIRYRELASALGVPMDTRVPVADARAHVVTLRRAKGMVLDRDDHDTWSAGSFFTNPVVGEADLDSALRLIESRLGSVTVPRFPAEGGVKLSAGWLIERAGFGRGYPDAAAAARLSTKHTLAITNRGRARTEDVLALAREVRDGVLDAFGIRLEPEPVLVGCAL